MNYIETKRLQDIANRKLSYDPDGHDVPTISDACIAAEEYEDDTQAFGTGLEEGISLAETAAQRGIDTICVVDMDPYSVDEGSDRYVRCYFLGTEDEVAAKLEALPDADEEVIAERIRLQKEDY